MIESQNKRMAMGFAKQAKADYELYEMLNHKKSERKVKDCHRLMILQMFLEKLAKAHIYSIADNAGLPNTINTSHNYIGKVIPELYKENRRQSTKSKGQLRSEMFHIRHICREIDLLNPAVDDASRRPDNCEYPWSQAGSDKVDIPAEYEFQVLSSLHNPVIGDRLIKTAQIILKSLLQAP